MTTLKIFSIFIMINYIFLLKDIDNNFVATNNASSVYDIELTDIKGEPFKLGKFQGKKILLVNVASECGYTKQYKDLQKLHEYYKEKLVVIGLPCNQFLKQESGNEAEIASFCKKNFGITFILTQKINVKGKAQHPLYKWLTVKELNGQFDSSVKWNFQKYLLDGSGKLIKVFYSKTNPMSSELTKLL